MLARVWAGPPVTKVAYSSWWSAKVRQTLCLHSCANASALVCMHALDCMPVLIAPRTLCKRTCMGVCQKHFLQQLE